MVTASVSDHATALVAVPKAKLELVRPIAPVKEILEARAELEDLIPKVLKEGVDFGKIPGAGDKLVLFKAGAERLCRLFGAHPEYEIIEKEVDHDRVNVFKSPWVDTEEKPSKQEAEAIKREKKGRWKKKPDGEFVWQVRGEGEDKSYGLYRYVFKCRIVRQDGLVLGECVGSASTFESKYIDRPRDCENTVIKIGQKRAYVGATLNAFGVSDRFTADVEDHAAEVPVPKSDVVDAEYEPEPKKPEPPKIDPAVAEAAKKAAHDKAMAFIHAHCDRVDAVGVLKDGATDDEKRGAFEAFTNILDEDKAAMDELKAKAPKLHLAVGVYDVVVGAYLSGLETNLSDTDKAAFEWLNGQRASREPKDSAA